MYGWERLVLLKHLLDRGLSKAAIAREVDVSRRSVHHWIATGQLDRDLTRSVAILEGLRKEARRLAGDAVVHVRFVSEGI